MPQNARPISGVSGIPDRRDRGGLYGQRPSPCLQSRTRADCPLWRVIASPEAAQNARRGVPYRTSHNDARPLSPIAGAVAFPTRADRHFRDARPRCQTAAVAFDPKADLHEYLQSGREVMLWKLDGLSEYDIRRPLVPTGTNLLGLVQHVASIETGYFGSAFGLAVPRAAGVDAGWRAER